MKLDLFVEAIVPLMSVIILSKFNGRNRIFSNSHDLRSVLEKASKGLYVRFNKRKQPDVSVHEGGRSLAEEEDEQVEVVAEISVSFKANGDISIVRDANAGPLGDMGGAVAGPVKQGPYQALAKTIREAARELLMASMIKEVNKKVLKDW